MAYYWLSFCDRERPTGRQFLGVAVVQAGGFVAAVRAAHLLGCNPGGEVAGGELDEAAAVPDEWCDRLLTRAEAEELDRMLTAQMDSAKDRTG